MYPKEDNKSQENASQVVFNSHPIRPLWIIVLVVWIILLLKYPDFAVRLIAVWLLIGSLFITIFLAVMAVIALIPPLRRFRSDWTVSSKNSMN